MLFVLVNTMTKTTAPFDFPKWRAAAVQHDMETENLVLMELLTRAYRDCVAKPRSRHWATMLFSSRLYFDTSVKGLFRMDSSSFAALHQAICPHLVVHRDASDVVDPPMRLSVFLYLSAQAASVRATADKFAIGPSTVSGIVKEVAGVICRVLGGLIAFPALRLCASHFAQSCGVPQSAGCIEGSHIPVSKPAEHGEMYFNRKCWYSIVLQAVVDWRGRFCDLDCKWPGRDGNSRVFRRSYLAGAFPIVSAASETVSIPTGVEALAQVPYFLLGDSGYQNTQYMVTTFEIAETESSDVCKSLNKRLAHARYRVECAFGRLKCRWRILLKGIGQDIEGAPDIVDALCIVQNVLMEHLPLRMKRRNKY
ncbi:DDE superfamily endonuclease [Phytophthora infestans]|uniref:DDE superfamily endonuclease n=1 Tax=Phytophthora infestans TaxID=4787 RepID=A0A8S9U0Z9_PHYIN|nr:DDE superfamily endonuclease [Phytophthora infestans]